MGVFGPSSSRASRRQGEISALDEFSFHVPEHCDMRTTRLEVDCFKKKREFVKCQNKNMISKHDNSLESLMSESDSEVDPISQEIELCLANSDFEVGNILPNRCVSNSSIEDPNIDVPYYESSSKQRCHQTLNDHASKCETAKVLLYPEEEWAKNARTVQWTIKLNKWWKRYCTVTESSARGSRNLTAVGKICQNRDGTLTITGRFKRAENPDFQLHLSARLSQNDYQNGYLMTGALQQGDLKNNGGMEITHFAVIPKHDQ